MKMTRWLGLLVILLLLSACAQAQLRECPPTAPKATVATADSTRWPSPNAFMIFEREPTITNIEILMQEIVLPEHACEMAGKVVVRILFDAEGNYVKHIVLKDPDPVYTKAVTAPLPHLKATPAMLDGQPAACWLTLPIELCFRAGCD